jgi:hypothetical protein
MSLRDQLQTIYDTHGQLTPDIVLEEARPKGHPLHNRVFDKPKAEAAEAYYRERAHELIQEVRISYANATGKRDSVRAWIAVPGETGVVYEPTEKIVQDDFQRRLVMEGMKREWTQMKVRYDQFQEFWELVAEDIA